MLDLASFHTYELERLRLARGTPAGEVAAIVTELAAREVDPTREPLSPDQALQAAQAAERDATEAAEREQQRQELRRAAVRSAALERERLADAAKIAAAEEEADAKKKELQSRDASAQSPLQSRRGLEGTGSPSVSGLRPGHSDRQADEDASRD